MSQHDYVINNDSGASVRADINSVLQAILSANSGTTEPTSTSAGSLWLDTAGGAPYSLKVRDAGNNHWLTLGTIDDPGSDKNMVLPQVGATTGMIAPFAFSATPSGWYTCDGTAISRATYSELFAVIGTTWGAGDGSATFNVPDLRGAFLRGTGSHGSSTMAGGGAFAGPSVGSYENDSFQDHEHTQTGQAGNAGPYANGMYPSSPATTNVVAGDEGTPRNSDGETKPFNAGIHYCIKT